MASVVPVPNATVNDSSELAAPAATSSPAPLVASATNPLQNSAAQGTPSAIGENPSVTLLSAQSTTNVPTAVPTPSAGDPDPIQVRPARESESVSATSATSPPTAAIATLASTGAPSQDTLAPLATSDTPSILNQVTFPAVGPASQSSVSSVTDPFSIPPSGITISASSPTAPPTPSGSSSSDTNTPTQTDARLISASSLPSTTSGASTSSGTSFAQNKGAIIGISVAGALFLVIFLIYVVMRVRRAQYRRRLDREMDESFQDAMDKAAAAAALQRPPSALSTHSAASYGAYAQPPLMAQPYDYGGYVPHPEYASVDYWAAAHAQTQAQAGPPAMVPQGMPVGVHMGQPMMQPPYATPAYVQPGLGRQEGPPGPPKDYLSNYTTHPAHPGPGYGSSVPSTPMQNPFDTEDQQDPNAYGGVDERRVLKVANE